MNNLLANIGGEKRIMNQWKYLPKTTWKILDKNSALVGKNAKAPPIHETWFLCWYCIVVLESFSQYLHRNQFSPVWCSAVPPGSFPGTDLGRLCFLTRRRHHHQYWVTRGVKHLSSTMWRVLIQGHAALISKESASLCDMLTQKWY